MIRLKISKQIHAYGLPATITKFIKKQLKIINPKWLDNHKMGRYNRETPKYIQIYEYKNKVMHLPVGWLEALESLLKTHRAKYRIYDLRISHPIKIRFKGELREFQKKACSYLLYEDGNIINTGTLEAPTGSGKTVMGIYMIAARKEKTLIIVHTKDLVQQWIERIGSFLHVNTSDVGKIGDGSFRIGNKITVALIQSLYKKSQELCREFGQVITDECHRAPSRTFTEVLNQLHCKYRLGLTATPYRRDNLGELIFWYNGQIRYKVDKEQLEKDGFIMMPKFIMRETSFLSMADPISEYSQMLSELTQDQERNRLILQDVSRQKGTALIISDRKYHLDYLSSVLWDIYKIQSEILTGSTKSLDRERIIKSVNSGKTKILFATGQLIGEGFDCKNLDALFLACPIRFSGRLIQYIGRILRPAKGKDQPVVFDYADIHIPTLRNSAMSRIRVYGKNNIEWR